MQTDEKPSVPRISTAEWLDAMDHADQHGDRFPIVDLTNGSPATEFAQDPDGYWKRAKAMAFRFMLGAGATIARRR